MALTAALSVHRFDLAALGDDALVKMARDDDEDAIRVLVRRHNRRLFRVARAVLKDDAEAEDVVQETYVRAFTSLASFRGEASLSTWLAKIALNVSLGRARRRRPLVEFTDDEIQEGRVLTFPSMSSVESNPESETARGHVRRLLEEAVDELPDPFRLVFVMRDIEGLNVDETASHLSIKPETVKTRLFRARRLLRNAIEQRLSAGFSELFPFDGARCAHTAERVIERLRTKSADCPGRKDG